MSSRDTGALIAKANRRIYNCTMEYKATDGRVYRLDRDTVIGDGEMKHGAARAMGRTSAALVFKMEFFLKKGFRYQEKNLPKGEQDRVIKEYGLEYNDDLHRYFIHEDTIFKIFQERFPEELEREHITDYSELSYRATHKR